MPDFDSCTYYNDRIRELCSDKDGKDSNEAVCYEYKDCLSKCKDQDQDSKCLQNAVGEECFKRRGCIYTTYGDKVQCNRDHSQCEMTVKCKMGNENIDCEDDDKCAPEHQVRDAFEKDFSQKGGHLPLIRHLLFDLL